jgi:heme A synthase
MNIGTILQLHNGVANMVVIFNGLLGIWGVLQFLRKEATITPSYWGGLALSPILGLVQMVFGMILVISGLGVAVRFVHYLYGALVIISVPGLFAMTHGRDDRYALLSYALLMLTTAGFGLRGVTTGYGG